MQTRFVKTEGDDNQNSAQIWNTRRILTFGGYTIAGTALCLLFGFFMVRATETSALIDSVLSQQRDSSRLLLAFSVTGHGEDGAYMRGYRVKFVDTAKNFVLDDKFIGRELDRIPPLPAIEQCDDENIWLVQKPEFIQGDTGFVAHIAITNGKLFVSNAPLPVGYALVDSRGPCKFRLRNKFNEVYCFATSTAKLTEGDCPAPATSAESYDRITTAFILVNKTRESTRYHVYYYATNKPDPMQISVGAAKKQSLLYTVWFSGNRLSQAERDGYREQLGPKDTLMPIFINDYLLSPATLYKSPDIAIYKDSGVDGKQRIQCFSHNGKQLWAIDDARFALGEKDGAIKVKIRHDLILLSSNKWVVAVDQSTNSVKWSYFF